MIRVSKTIGVLSAVMAIFFWTSVTEAKTKSKVRSKKAPHKIARETAKSDKKEINPQVDVILMKTPKGEVKKYVHDHSKRMKKPELPQMDVTAKQDLCVASSSSQLEMLDLVETQLELQSMIASLNKMDLPRELSLQQKVFVSQIPFCNPFITDLIVISRLLKGFDLVSVAKK